MSNNDDIDEAENLLNDLRAGVYAVSQGVRPYADASEAIRRIAVKVPFWLEELLALRKLRDAMASMVAYERTGAPDYLDWDRYWDAAEAALREAQQHGGAS